MTETFLDNPEGVAGGISSIKLRWELNAELGHLNSTRIIQGKDGQNIHKNFQKLHKDPLRFECYVIDAEGNRNHSRRFAQGDPLRELNQAIKAGSLGWFGSARKSVLGW